MNRKKNDFKKETLEECYFQSNPRYKKCVGKSKGVRNRKYRS